ncbi:MAG: nucleotidyltransferase family protein [Gemmatimonadota bacterium]|nr:nucleotidyltransferase family protein [Gemmatimonadota bacterium]MDH3477333.1 nucleotidyltransferase family protein [Gemmatimonadota bacterium]MDH3568914.1 nucleotidyltransferase family protein [Gemmatimonadota bacterium]MDH5549650.1 nucleotidyltransferase family protein [Gemmatimonadota bacterium]
MPDVDVDRRLRRYHRSWDPRHLWPEVSESAFLSATRQIADVTTVILTGSESRPRLDPDRDITHALPIAAFASGMGPLLGYWIESGTPTAPSDVARSLAVQLDHGRQRAARMRTELETVLGAFHQRGIQATVLKGMHTGWAYFPEPGTPPMADIDLLVEPLAVPAAHDALLNLGFTRGACLRERTTWIPSGSRIPVSLEMTHVDNPWDLDLHATLDRRMAETVPVSLGSVGPDDLHTWSVGPETAWVLSQPLLTAYLGVHVSSHFEATSLIRLVELALAIRRGVERRHLDWDALARRLRTTGSSAFAYPALELTEKLVPGILDSSLRALVRDDAPSAVRRLVDQSGPGTARRLHRHSLDSRLMWLATWRQRASWLWTRLWPHIGDEPMRPLEALRIQAERARRMLTGRMRWRRPG